MGSTIYNVSVWHDQVKKSRAGIVRVYTFPTSDWNGPFAVFYPSVDGNKYSRLSAMDLYTIRGPGYVKRHYNKVPEKYLPALWGAR